MHRGMHICIVFAASVFAGSGSLFAQTTAGSIAQKFRPKKGADPRRLTGMLLQ